MGRNGERSARGNGESSRAVSSVLAVRTQVLSLLSRLTRWFWRFWQFGAGVKSYYRDWQASGT